MAQLTHAQYDALERAVIRGTRIAIIRRGRQEDVIIPLALEVRNGREVVKAKHPTSGHDISIYLDEIDGLEPVS